MNLNIPYPWPIDWLPSKDMPIGLLAIDGWIEQMIEENPDLKNMISGKGKVDKSSEIYRSSIGSRKEHEKKYGG